MLPKTSAPTPSIDPTRTISSIVHPESPLQKPPAGFLTRTPPFGNCSRVPAQRSTAPACSPAHADKRLPARSRAAALTRPAARAHDGSTTWRPRALGENPRDICDGLHASWEGAVGRFRQCTSRSSDSSRLQPIRLRQQRGSYPPTLLQSSRLENSARHALGCLPRCSSEGLYSMQALPHQPPSLTASKRDTEWLGKRSGRA